MLSRLRNKSQIHFFHSNTSLQFQQASVSLTLTKYSKESISSRDILLCVSKSFFCIKTDYKSCSWCPIPVLHKNITVLEESWYHLHISTTNVCTCFIIIEKSVFFRYRTFGVGVIQKMNCKQHSFLLWWPYYRTLNQSFMWGVTYGKRWFFVHFIHPPCRNPVW